MQTIRTFIAVELPSSIQEQLDNLTFRLKGTGNMPVRWTPAKNIHLTLQFLGDTPDSKIAQLSQLLMDVAASFHSFTISLNGIGAFPNKNRPRIIWIGVQAPPELYALQKMIEENSKSMGFETEDRRFSPHLTLGRVVKETSSQQISVLSSLLTNIHIEDLGTMNVESISLIKSDLNPSGAVYKNLFNARLINENIP